MTFQNALDGKIKSAIHNNFGKENFDERRFGKYTQSVKEKIKNYVKTVIRYESKQNVRAEILKDQHKIAHIGNELGEASQTLLVDIIAYKILGYTKIKLPLNNNNYWEALEKVKSLKKGNEKIDPHFLHFILECYDLRDIGYDLELYFIDLGIAVDFIFEQYAYKLNGSYKVQAETGDVVLDIGACWGDTALYFADKVGSGGQVYAFEFIPSNIEIFNKNIGLNPRHQSRIKLIENPVAEKSNQKIYYESNGPGSRISYTPFDNQTGFTETISVDDFVEKYKILKVDFIKMDIEGAEPAVLKGALKTIKKYRPKLAIAIYHSMDDFVNIPNWLMDLNLNYEFYLGHYTIHAEEIIFFGSPKN